MKISSVKRQSTEPFGKVVKSIGYENWPQFLVFKHGVPEEDLALNPLTKTESFDQNEGVLRKLKNPSQNGGDTRVKSPDIRVELVLILLPQSQLIPYMKLMSYSKYFQVRKRYCCV